MLLRCQIHTCDTGHNNGTPSGMTTRGWFPNAGCHGDFTIATASVLSSFQLRHDSDNWSADVVMRLIGVIA